MGRRDEDAAGPRVNTASWPGGRTLGGGLECLYGERGKRGRCEPRGAPGDVCVCQSV